MCFDYSKADSSLDYASSKTPVTYISSSSTNVSDSEICTTEMLGIHNISYVRPIINRSIGLRKDIKASFEFLCTKTPLSFKL